MNKFIVVATITIATTANAAPNWTYLIDNQKGERVLVDVNSLYVNNALISLNIAKAESTGLHPFSVAVAKTSCAKQEGLLLVLDGGELERMWWTSRGNKVYDAIGKLLCDTLQLLQKTKVVPNA